METTVVNVIVTFFVFLGFTSAFIHYVTYAKAKAKVLAKKQENKY
jgi:hypothetical protein